MPQNHLTRHSAILLGLGFFFSFVAYDYVTYHSRYKNAIGVAQTHGGRASSLLGWPLGRECRIVFDQPIDRSAVADLAVLNSLTSRHSVGVAFHHDTTDAELEHARHLLPECYVFRVNPPQQRYSVSR